MRSPILPVTVTAALVAAALFAPLAATATAASSAPTTPSAPAASSAPTVSLHSNRVSAARWAQLAELSPTALTPQQAAAQSHSAVLAVPHLASQLYQVAGVVGARESVDGSTTVSKTGDVEVTVSGRGARAALLNADARVLAADATQVTATVQPNRLIGLAGAAGVDLVQPIRRAYSQATPVGEGATTSGAAVWQAAGKQGAGAHIAIVDSGFANLADEVAKGSLAAGTTVTGNHCANVNNDPHGTAIALIIHQMAPGATLSLYCVDDTVGLAQAGSELAAAGAQIVSCSLGFLTDARGDGTGTATAAYTSSAVTVARARKAGILWVNASGNTAQDHWAGTLTDQNKNGYVDLDAISHESDKVLLPAGFSTEVVLTWDQWPASAIGSNLRVDMINESTGRTIGFGYGAAESDLPNAPVRIVGVTNTTSAEVVLNIRVTAPKNTPALHYDLTYFGDVSSSYLSTLNAARAAAGSVTEPASSPYALAVGAAYWANNSIETFSSRGPTLDGRVKPDLIGYDGVSSDIYGASSGNFATDIRNPAGGFFGTSAAAPNVAGAAALIKAANPAMDASQVQALLEQRAKAAASPPTNLVGHGLLSLGDPALVAPGAGASFTPIAPVRVLDTRSGIGGRKGPVSVGDLLVSPPATVPANASAVVINLTGTGASGSTYLSVYPSTFAGTSNLNLSRTDPTAAVSATVALSAAHNFRVRNAANRTHVVIDVVGYYGPTGAGFAPTAPLRVLDTRNSLGAHRRKVAGKEVVSVSLSSYPQLPADATAVVLNLTATNMIAAGFVSAAASDFTGTSSLNYAAKYSRANLAVVGLAARAFKLRNSGQPVDLVADVLGYFSPTAPGKFHALASPVRIADTRIGTGGRHSPLNNGAQPGLFTAGLNDVPYAATAIVGGVVAVPTGSGVLTVYPNGQAVPRSSTLNYSTGRVVPNAFISGLGAGLLTVRNAGPSVAVAVDEMGYFSNS